VIARNSTFTYKGQAVDVKQIGRELGVRYVLEGSVRKAGGRVRITAQLIDATKGAHLWADRFDGSLEDVSVYPCHVAACEMRQHPIGTGPFKLVDFKPNESITVTRNPDYWKPGRPYLDGIEYSIIKDLSTRTLAFVGGKGDLI